MATFQTRTVGSTAWTLFSLVVVVLYAFGIVMAGSAAVVGAGVAWLAGQHPAVAFWPWLLWTAGGGLAVGGAWVGLVFLARPQTGLSGQALSWGVLLLALVFYVVGAAGAADALGAGPPPALHRPPDWTLLWRYGWLGPAAVVAVVLAGLLVTNAAEAIGKRKASVSSSSAFGLVGVGALLAGLIVKVETATAHTIDSTWSLTAVAALALGLITISAAPALFRGWNHWTPRAWTARLLQRIGGALIVLVVSVFYVLGRVFSVLDWILAVTVADLAGARVKNVFARYARLLAIPTVTAAALVFWPRLGLVLAGVGVLVAVALTRRWAWIEEDRVEAARSGAAPPREREAYRIGFDQELRDEALIYALVFFVLVSPLVLEAADRVFDLFKHPPGKPPDFVTWFEFMGAQLAKALPLFDWSEVYGFDAPDQLVPRGLAARHLVFAMRVAFDAFLISAIFQAFSISARIGAQRRRYAEWNDPLRRLDPFEERAALIKAAADSDFARSLPRYDDDCLASWLFSDNREAALGAARVAGFQLSPRALRILALDREEAVNREAYILDQELDPRVQARALRHTIRLRDRKRQEDRDAAGALAAEAVRSLIADRPEALRNPTLETIAAALESRVTDPERVEAVEKALDLTARRRERRWDRAFAAIGDSAAAHRVRASMSPDEAPELIEDLKSGLIFEAVEAASTLQLLGLSTPETQAALAGAMLNREEPEVRAAAAIALGALGGPEVLPALTGREADLGFATVAKALVRHVERHPEARATVITILRDHMKAGAPLTERGVAAKALGRLKAAEALPELLDLMRRGYAGYGEARARLLPFASRADADLAAAQASAAEAIAALGLTDQMQNIREVTPRKGLLSDGAHHLLRRRLEDAAQSLERPEDEA